MHLYSQETLTCSLFKQSVTCVEAHSQKRKIRKLCFRDNHQGSDTLVIVSPSALVDHAELSLRRQAAPT